MNYFKKFGWENGVLRPWGTSKVNDWRCNLIFRKLYSIRNTKDTQSVHKRKKKITWHIESLALQLPYKCALNIAGNGQNTRV